MTVIDLEETGVDRVGAVASGFGARLRDLEVADDAVVDLIEVGTGTVAYLTNDGRATFPAARLLVTDDIDRFKRWIGRPDDECADIALELPGPWPAAPGREELTAAEQRILDIAGNAYLFGDSRRVPEYRRILESHRSPFTAAVYAARRVVIAPGATLVVDGVPAALVFEDLTIHDTGRLVTYTAVNATFGRLHKIEGGGGHG